MNTPTPDLTPEELEPFRALIRRNQQAHDHEGEECDCVMCHIAPKVLTALDEMRTEWDAMRITLGKAALPLEVLCATEVSIEGEQMVLCQELKGAILDAVNSIRSVLKKDSPSPTETL